VINPQDKKFLVKLLRREKVILRFYKRERFIKRVVLGTNAKSVLVGTNAKSVLVQA